MATWEEILVELDKQAEERAKNSVRSIEGLAKKIMKVQAALAENKLDDGSYNFLQHFWTDNHLLSVDVGVSTDSTFMTFTHIEPRITNNGYSYIDKCETCEDLMDEIDTAFLKEYGEDYTVPYYDEDVKD